MTNPRPRVTIGLPIYNGAEFVAEAIESILAQTFPDFELLIGDNASSDATQEICERYAAQDSRIHYERMVKNLGASPNYNRLVHKARGEFFKWAAHDDLLAPTHLERCVAALAANPTASLAFPGTIFIDKDGKQIGSRDEHEFDFLAPQPSQRFKAYLPIARGWMNPMFGLHRLSVLRKTPLQGSYPSADMILMGELVLRGILVRVHEPLFYRREHPQMSVLANPNLGDRTRWFDSSYMGDAELTRWRWVSEFFQVIARVPMPTKERALCAYHMNYWLRRTRRELVSEVAIAARRAINTPTRV